MTESEINEQKINDSETESNEQEKNDSETEVPVDRVDEVNKLKTHYKAFYTDFINKVFEEKDKIIFTPKVPNRDEILNASKALNIKHGTETEASEYEIDDSKRQIILDGLVYRDFKTDQKSHTITFLEYDSISNVELAMKLNQETGKIEVEDWNNLSNWLSLTTYIEKLMTKYEQLDKKSIMKKQSELEVHYATVKRLVSDLANIFTVNEYYNV